MESARKYDLEDRLVKFAIMALSVCDLLSNSKAGQNLEHQLSKWDGTCIDVRRGTSGRVKSTFHSQDEDAAKGIAGI